MERLRVDTNVELQDRMQTRTIVWSDLEDSINAEISKAHDILKVVEQIPDHACAYEHAADQYFAVFDSPEAGVEHALAVRDAIRYFDWRRIGVLRPPRFRTAVVLGSVTQTHDAHQNTSRCIGQGFEEASRLEPIVAPGEVWTFTEIRDALKNNLLFYFRDLGDKHLSKNYGTRRCWCVYGPLNSCIARKLLRPPLEDEQRRGRSNALRVRPQSS